MKFQKFNSELKNLRFNKFILKIQYQLRNAI